MIPRSRRLTLDVLRLHKQAATCAHDRRFRLSRVAGLRSRLPMRISWALIYIKAFAIVAARRPVLRQSYQSWPWPHLYQHAQNVAMLATHRVYRDEPWVFWSRFVEPETQPLTKLQASLDRFLTEPPNKVFRQQWQLSGLPTPFRRFLWWWTLNVAAKKRARRAGTFFLTTLAGKGVEIQDPPAFLTSNLTYGPMDDQQECRVTLSYDHRLMDGSFVADCLIELEEVMNQQIAAELESILSAAQ
ncbi:hypothetical protein [Schlesneria sp.]|uniref:hypothetical protein n=1 Tax=Schlesneria sp. TaxID=2762018 RepID=UPI002EEDF1E5